MFQGPPTEEKQELVHLFVEMQKLAEKIDGLTHVSRLLKISK